MTLGDFIAMMMMTTGAFRPGLYAWIFPVLTMIILSGGLIKSLNFSTIIRPHNINAFAWRLSIWRARR